MHKLADISVELGIIFFVQQQQKKAQCQENAIQRWNEVAVQNFRLWMLLNWLQQCRTNCATFLCSVVMINFSMSVRRAEFWAWRRCRLRFFITQLCENFFQCNLVYFRVAAAKKKQRILGEHKSFSLHNLRRNKAGRDTRQFFSPLYFFAINSSRRCSHNIFKFILFYCIRKWNHAALSTR